MTHLCKFCKKARVKLSSINTKGKYITQLLSTDINLKANTCMLSPNAPFFLLEVMIIIPRQKTISHIISRTQEIIYDRVKQ